MSACRCNERKRPFKDELPEGSNDRPRQWFVLRRNESCSAFTGYKRRWSKTSSLVCRVCGSHWETQAQDTVDRLDNSEYFPQSSEPKVEPFE